MSAAGAAAAETRRGRLVGLALIAPAVLFLTAAFLLPLGQLVLLSFSSRAGPFAPYVDLLTSDVYRRVFANTLSVAAVTTVGCVLIGFPVAFVLARLSGGWRALLLAAVLFPLWISVLVRTFSWMLLLERNGPINRTLVDLGVIAAPLQLLFNQTGVLIGMIHVLLPYAILPIFAALVRIDPALYLASDGLGAGWFTTLRRVVLPLAAHGVATGAVFVFLLSLGFFITPALMGGAASITLPMLIETLVNERLVWPLAAAASVLLLVLTLVILAAASRFANVSGLAARP
jgi:ABC-type spermidine/putrescine transport system permease subunit I